MAVMKVAGKDSNNHVRGVAVSSEGNVITQKHWQNEVVKIYEETTPASGTHTATGVDLSDAGAVSLRIDNETDVGYTLSLYVDFVTNTYVMRNLDGKIESISIPASTNNIIITPDDWPVLQWISKLRLRITNSSAGTNGKLEVWAVVKR